jgi:hypothetical protein
MNKQILFLLVSFSLLLNSCSPYSSCSDGLGHESYTNGFHYKEYYSEYLGKINTNGDCQQWATELEFAIWAKDINRHDLHDKDCFCLGVKDFNESKGYHDFGK